MDKRFKDGFERMLSDVSDGPSWQELSQQQKAPKPAPTSRRGLLVAAAAFVVTIVAIGAVVLALSGGPESRTTATATVDHIEISWAQDVVLRCVGMAKDDNGGFGLAKVDVWGPNAEGLIRIDAVAPDGTAERVIATYPRDRASGRRVWSSAGLAAGTSVLLDAGCSAETPTGSSSYRLSDPPITAWGHLFDNFIAIPTERRDGSPLDIEAYLASDGTITQSEWRGIPVTVFSSEDTGLDDLGIYGNRSEISVDVVNRRYEVARYLSDHEVLGTVVTSIDVMKRDTVPANSVSFSTEDLNLTLDIPPIAETDQVETITTTSTTVPAAFDDFASIDAEIARRQALIDDAQQRLPAVERSIQDNKELLKRLEARTDPPTEQAEISRQHAVIRMSEFEKEYLDEVIRRNQAAITELESLRSSMEG